MEEKLCNECLYSELDVYDEPCNSCVNALLTNHPKYKDAQLLWTPKVTEEPEEPEQTEEVEEYDVIHRPSHYNREGAMESINEMILVFGKEAVKHFCLCNIWKYRYRAADKNGSEDIRKSDEYMRIYERLCSGE